MSFGTTIVFYLMIGAGVSGVVLLVDSRMNTIGRLFQAVAACVFWPLYLPVLLKQSALSNGVTHHNGVIPVRATADGNQVSADDSLAGEIDQVEAELDSALASLDGWAESVLAQEHDRFAELRAAWRFQAHRIRELDQLLSHPSFRDAKSEAADASTETIPGDERIRASQQSRRENLERLAALREQLYRDLHGTLTWVRELVTQIHLAKYTGAPVSRAAELVSQIAAAVEGLSEVAEMENSGRSCSA